MKLIVVGLNHKTAPVELREKIGFTENELPSVLKETVSLAEITESIVLSTCNRIEFYVVCEDEGKAVDSITAIMGRTGGIQKGSLSPYLYVHTDRDAVTHAFRVASSLDSMVIGEAQILGQAKDAYRIASYSSTTGPILNRLMHRAFSVAKKVRTFTPIGLYTVSVSSVAVELAKKIFGRLTGKAVLLMGAGEMAEDAAKYLKDAGASRLTVLSRTFGRASELAERLKGSAVEFDELYDQLMDVDIVVCSTSADHYLITNDRIAKIIRARQHRPLFFIDISVPRNIEPSISALEGVFLFDIDDLNGVTSQNMKEREKAANEAERFIDEEVSRFVNWLGELSLVPTIVSLREKFEAIRQQELKEAISKLAGPTKKDIEVLDGMSKGIINKILHGPITEIKSVHTRGEVLKDITLLKRIFKI
ncbi:MAG: glutamyl-tRNA reductase [Deltaproteobacteria bacterium]|nr:glutamyl-tRNA reductase [Deltaproteobacteria bacterium]MCL5277305.1 glutamyl-tRNA reductase [Deltaproteobacteria bacterium]